MRILTELMAELEAPRIERPFGSGWLSGAGALLAALVSLAAVASLHWPALLTTPELRAFAETPIFRFMLYAALIIAYGLAFLSIVLRDNKLLGFTALAIAMTAALMGGPESTETLHVATPAYFGLDFFVLNLLFTGFLFVPIERLAPRLKAQTLFRQEWREDLFYFLVSSLFVQMLAFLTLAPEKIIVATMHFAQFREAVADQNIALQIVEIMILTDLVQYWVHRMFHQVPLLWGFHAVHHSARSMDWLAGARMHLFEIIALRAMTAIPMFSLGYSLQAIQAYLLVVYVYSSFIHANLGWNFNWLGQWVVTPRFHHWHHGIDREAVDVNFAIHFPAYDRLFGTYHLPPFAWPSGYGVPEQIPRGYRAQFMYPFRRKG